MTRTSPGRQTPVSVLGTRLPESTARVTALLRCVLLAPLGVLVAVVHELEGDGSAYLVVLGVFALWTLAVTWWAFARPTPSWAGPVSTFVDLGFFIAMAISSAGVTSYITPVFYLYPLFTVFFYRPLITGVVGAVVAGGYALVWLDNLAIRGGPGDPGIVWMHFLLLVWMAVGTTALAVLLARRARHDAAARAAHDALTAQLLAADLRASTRVADNLHDGPLQNIIAVRRMLESLAGARHEPGTFAEATRVLAETTDALRGTVSALHPHVLRQLGLEAALRELTRASDAGDAVTVIADVRPLPPLTEEQQYVLFGAARELVINARRHAGASQIVLTARAVDGEVVLTVVDDGVGMPVDGTAPDDLARSGHIGLASHTFRVQSIGGSVTHRPAKDGGTVARVGVALRHGGDSPADFGETVVDRSTPR